MKQFQVETKNQATGEWRLYERFKCRYRLGYTEKARYWPLDCRTSIRLVVINEADAELEAVCKAVIAANHVNRKRRFNGSSVVACIETRVIELILDPNTGHRQKIIWENGEFGKKVRTNGANTV